MINGVEMLYHKGSIAGHADREAAKRRQESTHKAPALRNAPPQAASSSAKSKFR